MKKYSKGNKFFLIQLTAVNLYFLLNSIVGSSLLEYYFLAS